MRFPTNGRRKALPLGLIGAVVVLVAAAAAAWQFGLVPGALMRSDAAGAAAHSTVLPPPVSGSSVTGGAGGPEPHSVQSTSVPLISVPPPSTPGLPGAGSPAGVGPASQVDGAAPAASAAPASANPLVVTVREDSWIELRPAKGAPLIARLVKGGSTETFDLSGPATLVVGKPDAVSVTLRGQALALPPVPGKTISRVTLK